MTPQGKPKAARRRSASRGFTMVELLVAMSVGVVVTMAAFLLARNASTFFRNESRITAAQYAALIGVARLQSDLQRAAYMSSPNVRTDPLRCGDRGDWPAGLNELAGIRIEENGSYLRHPTNDHDLTLLNGLTPDAIVVGGALDTTEQFVVRSVVASAGGIVDIFLAVDNGAMQRTLANAAAGARGLAEIFRPGRFLRLIDDEGRHGYGLIQAIDPDPVQPRITLAATPAFPTRATNSTCGCSGHCGDALVNPVSRVLYDLRAVNPATYPRYAGLFVRAGHAAPGQHVGFGAAGRTELVRVELDASGNEIDETLEVIAEYAVDLKLGVTETTPGPTPLLTRHAIGAAPVYALAGSLESGATPQRVRAIQYRLSTRAAEPDRRVAVPGLPGGGVFRYQLQDGAGNSLGFARVRSIHTEIMLLNQQAVTW